MGKTKRVRDRNSAIQEMLSDGDKLRNFYRFTAQNPHINLHDACQIVIKRPDASICFSYEEWNGEALERRIIAGRKGIPYYDENGNKKFVFDVRDTHGKEKYKRSIYPMSRLLKGLRALTGAEVNEVQGDYRKIKVGVVNYLNQNELFSEEDEERNRLIIEGITYSLYCKTGFPKNTGISLRGMPYGLYENAELFKEMYIDAENLFDSIDEAYRESLKEIPVIDDTEEETVSDEPTIPVKIVEEEKQPFPKKEKSTNALYNSYMDAQEEYPNAIVIIRLGDFYEIMGENAKVIADELDLTLTGRDVGLEERVPMVGFPYHVADQYIEKILKKHSIVVVEQGEEPKYILSHKQVRDESEKPRLIELSDEDATELGNAFDDGELTDVYDGEYDEEASNEQEGNQQLQEKKGKSIKERKRKEKSQISLFDFMEQAETKEASYKDLQEQMIKRQLKRGSGFQHGKFRIYEKYQTNPSINEFAELLKKEYGVGGYGSYGDSQSHDAKGIKMSWRKEETRDLIADAFLKWNEVAVRVADLIDDGDYLTEEEKEKYNWYLEERNEQIKSVETVNTTQTDKENPELTTLNEIGLDQTPFGGAKSKFRSNIEAIRLMERLYVENRAPTNMEKLTLAKYVGWGGLAKAFDEKDENWQKEYKELKETLSTDDYANARASVLSAYYTPKEVIEGMYSALEQFGVRRNVPFPP
ncbi:MAG: hypothetical protein IJ506_07320 [Clostridia bacterium]|nr:hypothetical protein [Clostridia bacterium]